MLSPSLILGCFAAYFLLLLYIAWRTSRNSTSQDFFVGSRKSKWYLVAYGMIGTSLSGVTFMSVPGKVGAAHFGYFQIVIGYFLGYLVVAFVLLPLYYKHNLTSIYNYLQTRFGKITYKTGASFFLLSRTLGATLRIFLVINVLQIFVLDAWNVPFVVTTLIILAMILLYTFKGGVKTIVWTDTLQTTFMLLALVVCVVFIMQKLNLSFGGMMSALNAKHYTDIFSGDVNNKKFFLKQILGGMFITIAMTGLDQEMMQKNISVSTLRGAQKNMLSFSVVLVAVNFLFLLLGGVLYLYAEEKGIAIPKLTDDLFPSIALQYLSPLVGLIFIIGLISALFPSADGALTALTSSFCIDILGINRNEKLNEQQKTKTRLSVHLAMSIVFLICIVIFKIINQRAIIDLLLDIAGYTYGPLLGLFAFGIFTKRKFNDKLSPIVCLLAPAMTYGIFQLSEHKMIAGEYQVGLELLLINGVMTFVGLFFISKKN